MGADSPRKFHTMRQRLHIARKLFLQQTPDTAPSFYPENPPSAAPRPHHPAASRALPRSSTTFPAFSFGPVQSTGGNRSIASCMRSQRESEPA